MTQHTTEQQQEAATAQQQRRTKYMRRGKVARCMAIIREMSPMEVLRVQENIATWKKELIEQLGGTTK